MHTDEEIENKKDDIILNGTKDERICALEEDIMRFAFYYFPEFFIFETPDFHYDMMDDLDDLDSGEIKELIWCMFRESAKTSWAQLKVIHQICYRKSHYINVDSFDKDNSEQFIFDIANYLQGNKRLANDFGQLYITDSKTSQKQKELKRVDKFDTTTGIRVEAFSTQTSVRGRKYKHYRPDFFVLDDFEVSKTADSYAHTIRIRSHIDEIRGGVGQGVKIMYLCNYVTESGNVQYLMELAKKADAMRVRKVEIEMNGEIVWKGKFVRTKAEAEKINKGIEDQKSWVMSLEEKKETLGENEYQKNYMNNPGATQDIVFDRIVIENAIENAKKHPIVKENAGFQQWVLFNAKHRYAVGADTSEGVGKDSNTSIAIDFTSKPAVVVATYANNRIAPDTFAHELKRHGLEYGECLIAPEINNTGFATVTELRRIYPVEKLYKRMRKDMVNKQITKEIGWKTTSSTKAEIIYQLKSAIESGELAVYDQGLLEEAKLFNQNDLRITEYKEGMTKHFDKVMACAIAWEMRNHAQVMEPIIENKNKNWKQKEWQSTSLYQD